MLLGRSARRRRAAEGIQPASTGPQQPLTPTLSVADLVGDGNTAQSPLVASTSSASPGVSFTTATPAPERNKLTGDGTSFPADAQSLSIEQLRHLWDAGASLIILDVRTDRTYDPSPTQARGAIRMPPDHVAERASALNLPHDAWIVGYCA
jgi:hypothetical protein